MHNIKNNQNNTILNIKNRNKINKNRKFHRDVSLPTATRGLYFSTDSIWFDFIFPLRMSEKTSSCVIFIKCHTKENADT